MTISIPRARTGLFSPLTMALLKKNGEDIDDLCLLLTRKGMTARDISEVLEEFFQGKKSHASINNLAKQFHELRQAWENSALQQHYTAIFCDVLFITVRRGDSYSKEGVYLAYGVRQDGRREVLSLEINPTESAAVWGEFLTKLRQRGVRSAEIVIADGLTGMEEIIHRLFPVAKFQKCVVHKMRQIMNKTRPKEKEEMAFDLKHVFDNFGDNADKEHTLHKLSAFCTKWKQRYPHIYHYLNEGTREYYFTYIEFPVHIRRMIYTTNSIENLNRIIQKATKNKLSFESPDTLLDFVFIVAKDFEDSNLMKYPVYNFISQTPAQTQFS
jgi:transposase-like protein